MKKKEGNNERKKGKQTDAETIKQSINDKRKLFLFIADNKHEVFSRLPRECAKLFF